MSETKKHRAGFVGIVGKPNVGKSTLMNVLVGERLSIITSKAQTTRHRIMGILNGTHAGEEFQLIYSDTPGIIKPIYNLHQSMMDFVKGSIEDSDVILFVTDVFEKYDEEDAITQLQKIEDRPILLLINKTDLASAEQVTEKQAYWQQQIPQATILEISALQQIGIEELFDAIFEHLPQHPPYFPKDELTDKPERFFVSEIIREKILKNYKKEIPYSCEVVVIQFQEEKKLIRICTEILVERPTQKGIIIGHKGEALKKTATEARLDLEAFFGKPIFLETFVKVEEEWRSRQNKLREFGYMQS